MRIISARSTRRVQRVKHNSREKWMTKTELYDKFNKRYNLVGETRSGNVYRDIWYRFRVEFIRRRLYVLIWVTWSSIDPKHKF